MVQLAKLPKSQLKFKSILSRLRSKVSFKPRVVIPIVSVLLILVSIPIGVYLLGREQNPESEASIESFTMAITSGSPSCGLACFDGSSGDGGRIQPCGSCCSCNCVESVKGYVNPTVVDPGEAISFSVTSNQSFTGGDGTRLKLLTDPTVVRGHGAISSASDGNSVEWSYPGSIAATAAPGVYTASFKGVGFNNVDCIYGDYIVYEVNGAPTGSISADVTTVNVGETVTFTVNGADANNDLGKIGVYKSLTSSSGWTGVVDVDYSSSANEVSCASDGASCPGTFSWIPTESDYDLGTSWYVVLNVYDDTADDKYNQCTGNPFSVDSQWDDCSRLGDTDVVIITLTNIEDTPPVCDSLSYVDLNGPPFIVGDPFSVTCNATSADTPVQRIRFGIVRESDNAICKTQTTSISSGSDGYYVGTVCYDPDGVNCANNDFANCSLLNESGKYFVYSSVCVSSGTASESVECTPFGNALLN